MCVCVCVCVCVCACVCVCVCALVLVRFVSRATRSESVRKLTLVSFKLIAVLVQVTKSVESVVEEEHSWLGIHTDPLQISRFSPPIP